MEFKLKQDSAGVESGGIEVFGPGRLSAVLGGVFGGLSGVYEFTATAVSHTLDFYTKPITVVSVATVRRMRAILTRTT